MKASITKRIVAATKAERPKAPQVHVMGVPTAMDRRIEKQIVAATKAERPKAAKAQVVGVGPHDD